MYFDQTDGLVMGAEIKNYLLEKSRVVSCTKVERNYHIFFFMIRGAEINLAKQLGFVKADGKTRKSFPDFKFLEQCNDLPLEKDLEGYKELEEAFQTLGFTDEEVLAIHKLTAACLHVGQIEIDVSTYSTDRAGTPC